MRRRLRQAVLLALLAWAPPGSAQTADSDNPTCPPSPNWSDDRKMRLTVQAVDGRRVLLAEGVIDQSLLPRLEMALQDPGIEEIRLRSPGGNARIGNQAGMLIRQRGIPTHIPSDWACAGACAFMFLGGSQRSVAPGGLYIVQMFSIVGDRDEAARQIAQGGERAADLMTRIARGSARFASEDIDYLIRMGVRRSLLNDIIYRQRVTPTATDRSTRRCLTPAEMSRYGVTTWPGRR